MESELRDRSLAFVLVVSIYCALALRGTGYCDAGVVWDGHIRSGAADVRVDAVVDFGPIIVPREMSHLAVELDAVTAFSFGGHGEVQ